MTRPAKLAIAILVAAALSSCGREGTPTGPSGPTSFLSGTWRGTVTIQVNPGDPNPPAPMIGESPTRPAFLFVVPPVEVAAATLPA